MSGIDTNVYVSYSKLMEPHPPADLNKTMNASEKMFMSIRIPIQKLNHRRSLLGC